MIVYSLAYGDGLTDAIDLADQSRYWMQSVDFSQPGQLTLTLYVTGRDPDERAANVAAIIRLVNLAPMATTIGSAVTFGVRRGVSEMVWFDVFSGSVTPAELIDQQKTQRLTVTLTTSQHARGAPITIPISGTLSGLNAAFVTPPIPGDAPALAHLELTDTSPSGAINRARLGVATDDAFSAASDYAAWVDLTALAGASAAADATAVGGGYVTRTLTGTSYLDLARATNPAGNRAKGRFDGYLRVWSQGAPVNAPSSLSGAHAIAQPGAPSLTVTPDTPTTTSQTSETPGAIAFAKVRTATASGTANTSLSLSQTWGASTAAGSLWVAFVGARSTNATTISITPDAAPPGWTLVWNGAVGGTINPNKALAVYVRENAPVASGTTAQSFSVTIGNAGATAQAALVMLELTGVPASSTIDAVSFNTSLSSPSLNASASKPGMVALAGYQADAAAAFNLWFGTELADTGSLAVGMKALGDAASGTLAAIDAGTAATGYAGALLVIAPTYATTTTSASAPSANPPGRLGPGSYSAWAQAVNADGIVSPAATSASASVTVANSSLTVTWGAVAGADHYRVTIGHGGAYYQTDTVGGGTSLTITDLTSGTQVGGVPSTTSVTARVQAMDATGALSNASSSATAAWLRDGGGVTWSWSAPVGTPSLVAYVLTMQVGSNYYVSRVSSATTTVTITSVDGLDTATGLPATSGATGPAPRLRARIGLAGDTTLSDLREVALSGDGVWRLARVFADRPLPPVDATIDGDWPGWQIAIQARNANGAASTFVSVDALWLVPSREPQVILETLSLAETAKRRWVIESGRSGRGVTAWLEDPASGVEAGRVKAFGSFTLPPGSSIVSLAFEQAAGAANTTIASVTATLTVWPRYQFERGAV